MYSHSKKEREGSCNLKKVIVEDKHGYLHAYLLRDGDPDSMAEQGVPLEPPDINRIPWEEVKRDLHNMLVKSNLFSHKDVQRKQNAISSLTRTLLKRRIVMLYRLDEQEVKNG